jgi:glycine reductase complex component B subunit alpha and beta
MRLEMGTTRVKDVRFSDRTRVEGSTLEIDRAGLRRLLLEDDAFADVSLDIARPAESARIIHVMDVAEPRWKPEPGSTFPLFVGPPRTVGEGRTVRLEGVAVVSASEAVAGEPTYWREGIIDMAGPGADATPLGATTNLVLTFTPSAPYRDATRPDAVIENIMVGSALAQRFNRRVRVAQLKVAAYLARAAAAREPDHVRTFAIGGAREGLPKVVYFYQLSGSVLYGGNLEKMLPTMIHPSEVLDGAIINVRSNLHATIRASTYDNQNHAIIGELYDRHGRDVDFRGVIVYPAASDDINDKEIMAEYAVKLARLFGADAACASYAGGGHPAVEFMLICQKAERAGIRTVLVMPETYGLPDDPGFVYFVPEAERIVSTGRTTQSLELPRMERVIGGEAFFDLEGSAADARSVPYRYLFGSGTAAGGGRLTARQY